MTTRPLHRSAAVLLVACIASVSGLWPVTALAAERTAVYEFRNHCEGETASSASSATFGGPLPEFGASCIAFTVKDPLTIETGPLQQGDVLDFDVVLRNPSKYSIDRIRTWVSYDPTILSGSTVEIGSSFPIKTPGESDFSKNEGYIKIGASADGEGPKITSITVARVRMTVIATTSSSTALSFYDAQTDIQSRTVAITGTAGAEENVLSPSLPALVVRLQQSASASSTSVAASASSSRSSGSGSSVSSGSGSSASAASVSTSRSSVSSALSSASSRSSTSSDADASSLSTVSSRSSAASTSVSSSSRSSVSSSSVSSSSRSSSVSRGPFSQQQVQGLQVSTEGTSVFLAWEKLPLPELAGYNVYYGTVSGQYIQRRSVERDGTSITLKSFPQGLTYYFAVRGVNASGQESDYSQEVAIVIGDPDTSTSPLTANIVRVPSPNPTVQGTTVTTTPQTDGTVAGATGVADTIYLLVIASAVIGTVFAFRRQLIASSDDL